MNWLQYIRILKIMSYVTNQQRLYHPYNTEIEPIAGKHDNQVSLWYLKLFLIGSFYIIPLGWKAAPANSVTEARVKLSFCPTTKELTDRVTANNNNCKRKWYVIAGKWTHITATHRKNAVSRVVYAPATPPMRRPRPKAKLKII